MGRTETPSIFLQVFYQPVREWTQALESEEERQMWLHDPRGGRVSGALVGFADDLFKKHLVNSGQAKEAANKLKQSTFHLDTALAKVGLCQNKDKRELVPRLKGRETKSWTIGCRLAR